MPAEQAPPKTPPGKSRPNPLKLNNLQVRTLALAQILAADAPEASKDRSSGDIVIDRLPHAHGNHVHVGPYVVSARDASGFGNDAVWTALGRKGLARRDDLGRVIITAAGVAYDTGLSDKFAQPSDH